MTMGRMRFTDVSEVRWQGHGMSPEHRRLTLALLLSLLIHALLLSLMLGGQGLGLPGFGFLWQERRIEVPDLRVVLVPAQVFAAEPPVTPAAVPLPQAQIVRSVAAAPAPTPSVSPAPTLERTVAAILPEASPMVEASPGTDAAIGAAPEKAPHRAERPDDTPPPSILLQTPEPTAPPTRAPTPAPAVDAMTRSDEATWVVAAAPPTPTPVIPTAPGASSPETATPPLRGAGDAPRARIDQEARERAVELARLDRSRQESQRKAEQLEASRLEAVREEAARTETARLETERADVARQAAARQETSRQEVAREEAVRAAAARLEAERRATARQAAARQETVRQETVRQEAAREQATRQELARAESARQETERSDIAQQDAARQEAARTEAAQEAAKREAVLRAIGQQLDEEAARRDAASTTARQSPALPSSSSGARRGRLFGRTDPNAELILYAEAWSRKIQLNMTFDMVREEAQQPHTDPLVTVAIRSDGSVESVTFVRSSGVAALDEAIRRVVQSQVPYQAFQPVLAREFDVIEIRRTWYFDMAIRLY